ncbi:VCBS repeat-containing protein, partial [bacterium AH-315-F03]|nr:VCBS repeat-containing protein [bacterium AH-315-F03]
ALDGWPQFNPTGQVFLGFPTPQPITLTPEAGGEAIVYLNSIGQLRAFHTNGESYFYSLGGLFTRIDPNLTNNYQFRGLSIPQIGSFDYNRDGRREIMAAYSSPGAVSGLFLFNGRDGQPVGLRPSAEALRMLASHGMALGDVDNDGVVEVLISGQDENKVFNLWLRRNGEEDLAGWPIELPELKDWIGGYPILADLDGDDIPEAIAVYTEFDISRIFVFRLNGDPFRVVEGLGFGELLRVDESLSSISVADIDGDGNAELVTRGGFVFPGSGFERIHAFTIEGKEVPGFPIVTTAHPATVTSFGYVPLIDDLDNDGLVEIALVGSGKLLHIWDMPGEWNPRPWNWPRIMHDNRNSSFGGKVELELGAGATNASKAAVGH